MTREPEWDDVARNRALALIDLEDTTCNGCGGDLRKTLEPFREGFHYEVDTETVCWSCASLEMVKRDESKAHEGDHDSGDGRFQYSDGRVYTVRLEADDDLGAGV